MYAEYGDVSKVRQVLEGMLSQKVFSWSVMIGVFDKEREIHGKITRQGLLWSYIVPGNALVDMYAKCGDALKARRHYGKGGWELPLGNPSLP